VTLITNETVFKIMCTCSGDMLKLIGNVLLWDIKRNYIVTSHYCVSDSIIIVKLF